jgi:hypothetical protein
MTDDDLYVPRLVDQAPPLTAEQRNQLGELLKPLRTGVVVDDTR